MPHVRGDARAYALGMRAVRLSIAACLALAVTPTQATAATAPPRVTTPAALLTTNAGVDLWSRAPLARRHVASTIKLLNALVVRERAGLDETVVVSPRAAAIEDGDVGLVAGQRLTVRKLLEIMLVASGNDAAEALAIHIAGGEARYVALMNAKARQIGLSRTLAIDPHGLSKREYSSASDLAVLGRRALADPWLRRIVNMRSVVVPRAGGKRSVYRSTFEPIWTYAGLQGVKTGYTRAAGYCFVGSARRGGVELVGVVLGARSNADRFAQMRRLLDWGFAHAHVRELVSADATFVVPPSFAESTTATSPGTVPPASESATPCAVLGVVARPARAVSLALLDGSGPVTRRVRAATETVPPYAAGGRVGTLDLLLGTRVIASVAMLAIEAAPAPEAAQITASARVRVASLRVAR